MHSGQRLQSTAAQNQASNAHSARDADAELPSTQRVLPTQRVSDVRFPSNFTDQANQIRSGTWGFLVTIDRKVVACFCIYSFRICRFLTRNDS
jgi:hypothetical protein